MDISKVKVRDLMVTPVYQVGLKDPLTKVADKMIKTKTSGIIVLDKEKPVGIVYATDLVKYIFAPEKAKEVLVEEVVERQEEVTLNEDMSLKEALKIMLAKNRRKLPVVNSKGEIVGVFSMVDAVKYLVELL